MKISLISNFELFNILILLISDFTCRTFQISEITEARIFGPMRLGIFRG
jgi:hypothetical protein